MEQYVHVIVFLKNNICNLYGIILFESKIAHQTIAHLCLEWGSSKGL